MIDENSEGYLDPSIEIEASKFEQAQSEPGKTRERARDRLKKMVRTASFTLGLIQFMSIVPGKVEASTTIERGKDMILQNAIYSICQQALPDSMLKVSTSYLYELEDGAINKTITNWCSQKDSRASTYVNKFASYNKPVFGDERDNPKRIYEQYQQDNIKDLEQLGKKHSIDTKTLVDLENQFVGHLKEDGHIGAEFSQLERDEVVSEITVMDAAIIIENIINTLPNEQKIPSEIKDEVINDLAQYLVLRASQVSSWAQK